MSSLTREEGIRHVAAGAPFPLPMDMTAAAIASGQSIEQFAIATAEHCTAARAAAREEAEIGAVVARIIGGTEAPARQSDAETSASAIAREIPDETRTASAHTDDAAVDAVVRRIEAA
jgi:hypothetical protein